MRGITAIEKLAEIYPQLYLDPDREKKETYRAVVLQGEIPETKSLSHFTQDPLDREETVQTPAGVVQVVSLRNRQDYERFVRCMMAAKEGPETPVPATIGASTLIVFNWPRIRAHYDQFMAQQKAAGVSDPDWGAGNSPALPRFTRTIRISLLCSPGAATAASAPNKPDSRKKPGRRPPTRSGNIMN